jgi:hypothetical protein
MVRLSGGLGSISNLTFVAPAGGAAVAAREGVRLHARRPLPLPPRGGRW